MEKKKRGLQLPEVILIALVLLVGLYSLVLLIYAGENSIMLKNSFKFFLQVFSFGFMKYSFELTEIFYITFVIFYMCIIAGIVLFFVHLRNKRGRSIIAIIDYILGSATLVYGMCIYQGNRDIIMGRTHSKLTVAAMCLVLLITMVAYALGILALSVATKESFVHYDKITGKTKAGEEKVVVKEVVREVIKEVPVPVKVEPKEEPKEEPKKEPKPEPVKEEPKVEVKAEPEVEEVETDFRKIERVPFADKVRRSDRELKDKYDELRAYLAEYGLKSRISIDGDSYRLHRVLYVHITIAGKKMKVYFKLNPNDFLTSPIPVRDASKVKKYEEVPAELDVKSDLSVKRAKELIDLVMDNAGLEKVNK